MIQLPLLYNQIIFEVSIPNIIDIVSNSAIDKRK